MPGESCAIVFVGGPRAAGKSAVLSELKKSVVACGKEIEIVPMYEILSQIGRDRYNKTIGEINADVLLAQSIQIEIIKHTKKSVAQIALLDGHYLSQNGKSSVPIYRTDLVDYSGLLSAHVVVTASPEVILARRKNDGDFGRNLDIKLVKAELDGEVDEAKRIGKLYNTPVYIIENIELKKTVADFRNLLRI